MVREPTTTYRRAAADYFTANDGVLLAGAGDGGPMQWSDAWLLHAIMVAQSGKAYASLEDIIGAGDFINHAIFSFDELTGGFRRLERAGFIEIDGARCKLTDAFFVGWKAHAGQRSLEKQSEALRKLIGAPPWRPARPAG